jgi:hypothetical protein
MSRRPTFVLTLPLVAFSTIAAAQSPPSPPPQSSEQPIVVEGTTNPRKQVEHFIEQLTPAHIGEQLGRFLEPICPRVVGLPASEESAIEARMMKVASAVGAPVASGKCAPNIYVIVGGDKRETIQGIRNQFPGLAGDVPAAVFHRLEKAPGPVAAWQVVGEIGADGMPLEMVRTSTAAEPVPFIGPIGVASRIVRNTVPQFLGSVLVIDSRALNGVDTRQLADYALMRTLVPTDTTHQAMLPVSSILQLFDPGMTAENAPSTVTWWDFAFLKAFYSSKNDVVASHERDQVAHKMEQTLAKLPPDKN